jgi:preprotein translocase subunit SecD
MNKNIRWKVITILAVLVIFAGVGVYPIVASSFGIKSPSWLMQKQLKLGLDLKGGVHLVLRVQTDDAIRLETDQAAERLREALRMRNIMVMGIATPSISQIRVEGVPPTRMRRSAMRPPISPRTSTAVLERTAVTPSR